MPLCDAGFMRWLKTMLQQQDFEKMSYPFWGPTPVHERRRWGAGGRTLAADNWRRPSCSPGRHLVSVEAIARGSAGSAADPVAAVEVAYQTKCWSDVSPEIQRLLRVRLPSLIKTWPSNRVKYEIFSVKNKHRNWTVKKKKKSQPLQESIIWRAVMLILHSFSFSDSFVLPPLTEFRRSSSASEVSSTILANPGPPFNPCGAEGRPMGPP